MPQSTIPYLQLSCDDWEDTCRESGFEYIDAEAKGRNEFGEPVGIERLKEALETTEWDAADGDFGTLSDGDSQDRSAGAESEEWTSFAAEESEMNSELLGMKSALDSGETHEIEAAQVEELERMMTKLWAIKGISFPVHQLPSLIQQQTQALQWPKGKRRYSLPKLSTTL